MKNKGFMFVETIVVSVVLMIALLYVYESFSNSISKQKSRINYNSVSGSYKLYYLKKMLIYDKKFNFNSTLFPNNSAANIVSSGNNYVIDGETLFSKLNHDNYNGVAQVLGIKKMHLSRCEDIPKTEVNNFYDASDSYKEYLKTLKACTTGHYRFTAEFYDPTTKIYSYAWVEFPESE